MLVSIIIIVDSLPFDPLGNQGGLLTINLYCDGHTMALKSPLPTIRISPGRKYRVCWVWGGGCTVNLILKKPLNVKAGRKGQRIYFSVHNLTLSRMRGSPLTRKIVWR